MTTKVLSSRPHIKCGETNNIKVECGRKAETMNLIEMA